jgi:hypothetical protein
MSVKKTITLKKGITGEFICRIESVRVCNKPAAVAEAVAYCYWYADDDEKNAGRTLVEPMPATFPVAPFIGTMNPIEQAYVELKKAGGMLEGGSDV